MIIPVVTSILLIMKWARMAVTGSALVQGKTLLMLRTKPRATLPGHCGVRDGNSQEGEFDEGSSPESCYGRVQIEPPKPPVL